MCIHKKNRGLECGPLRGPENVGGVEPYPADAGTWKKLAGVECWRSDKGGRVLALVRFCVLVGWQVLYAGDLEKMLGSQ